MAYKNITQEQAYSLWQAGVASENRYREVDADAKWGKKWCPWRSVRDWGEEDWQYVGSKSLWEEEFRVEVE